MSVDPYQRSGEFLDLLSRDAWEALREPVAHALRGVVPANGPILDVGAGSGLGTLVAAGTVADAEILAVEPSAVLRAVLLARVAADPDLRRRVTVLPGDAGTVAPPDRLGAVLAMNMVGHLSPEQRRAFWHRIGERLAPGAPLVVNLQPPATAAVVPTSVFARQQVGQYVYEGSGGAEPTAPDVVTWHLRYRVLDAHGQVLRDLTADYDWHVVAPRMLLDELSEAGFTAERGALDVVRAVRNS
ncbi:class I SAM-dependent methyltransferase [Micromonospora sp. CPCC 206060]|uniref:class I SAM-dependent methyltransferase n=1 Tax=Micromonospora sp. CPCC 206060 TaxID=3122406 RepID=UPI002FF1F95F